MFSTLEIDAGWNVVFIIKSALDSSSSPSLIQVTVLSGPPSDVQVYDTSCPCSTLTSPVMETLGEIG